MKKFNFHNTHDEKQTKKALDNSKAEDIKGFYSQAFADVWNENFGEMGTATVVTEGTLKLDLLGAVTKELTIDVIALDSESVLVSFHSSLLNDFS